MTQQTSVSPRAWAGIFLMALIWGASFLSIRVALDEVPVLTLVAFRVGGAALALWVFVLLRGYALPRGRRVWGALLVMGFLGNALPFTLITWGQLRIPSGLASILNASTAIFGVLVAAIFLADERLSPRKLTGVILGFIGVATAIGLGNLARLDLTSLSQLALIGSSISYAFANVWGRTRLRGIAPQVSAAGMLSAAALFMVPLALWRDGVPSMNYSLQTIAALSYLALVASAFVYMIYYKVLEAAGAGNVSLTTLLVAPVAIMLGAVVLDETLRPQAYVGFAVLAVGLLILDGRLWRWAFGQKKSASSSIDIKNKDLAE